MNEQPIDLRLLAIYEKFYFFEMERREKLSARFPMLIAVYSILLAGITSSLASLPGGKLTLLLLLFYAFLAVQGCMFALSLWHAVQFLFAETYSYARQANQIGQYIDELREFNSQAEPGEELDLDRELTAYLCTQYCKAATLNFDENNIRYGNFSKALRYVIIAAVIALLGAIPYFVLKSGARNEIPKVQIVNTLKR